MVGECKGEIEGIPAKAFILNTAWKANTKANRRLRICQAHLEFHGKKFKEKTADKYRKCKHCIHPPKQKGTTNVGQILYDFSEEIRRKGGKYSPFTCPICPPCNTKLRNWSKQKPEAMDDTELSSQGSNVTASQGSSAPNSQASKASDVPTTSKASQDQDYEPMEEDETEIYVPEIRTINDFLKANNQKEQLTSRLHQSWLTTDPSRKRSYLRALAAVNKLG